VTVSQSTPLKLRTSIILECHLLSINMCIITYKRGKFDIRNSGYRRTTEVENNFLKANGHNRSSLN